MNPPPTPPPNIPESTKVKLRLERILLENMKSHVDDLRKLLDRVNGLWVYEDYMYRFYYQSYKVYRLQEYTAKIVSELQTIAPEAHPFCDYFRTIIRAGTDRVFTIEVNKHWIEETLPITQAFLHARYFLEMAVKYHDLPEPPQRLPSGWAGLLCLFDIR